MKALLLVGAILSTGCNVFAEGKAAAQAGDDTAAHFRCERVRNTKLVDMKAKLVENCDLDRPFSFSNTDIGVETTFTYCCHTK